MNVVYKPCHSILCFDQYKLWTELGHDVFSTGSYINPLTPHDNKRPPIPTGKYHPELASLVNGDKLHPDIIDWADVIIVDHLPDWIGKNWPDIKHKRVVWRTIGQSVSSVESYMKPLRDMGVKIVRCSPYEQNIPDYIGHDAMIRFYKDPDEFYGYTGELRRVITVAQAIKSRGEFCHYNIWKEVTEGLPHLVYGAGNENLEQEWGGQLSYEELKMMLRYERVFFYTGTQPASYTLGFIEAMMTGIPIVSIGGKLANSIFRQNTYEVPSIIQNCINGFC
jgi:hypothetical protein